MSLHPGSGFFLFYALTISLPILLDDLFATPDGRMERKQPNRNASIHVKNQTLYNSGDTLQARSYPAGIGGEPDLRHMDH